MAKRRKPLKNRNPGHIKGNSRFGMRIEVDRKREEAKNPSHLKPELPLHTLINTSPTPPRWSRSICFSVAPLYGALRASENESSAGLATSVPTITTQMPFIHTYSRAAQPDTDILIQSDTTIKVASRYTPLRGSR